MVRRMLVRQSYRRPSSYVYSFHRRRKGSVWVVSRFLNVIRTFWSWLWRSKSILFPAATGIVIKAVNLQIAYPTFSPSACKTMMSFRPFLVIRNESVSAQLFRNVPRHVLTQHLCCCVSVHCNLVKLSNMEVKLHENNGLSKFQERKKKHCPYY